MNEILEIKERTLKLTHLPDGTYIGIWGGNIIELTYNNMSYELTTNEGVRGIGFKVVVTVKDGVATYEEIKNK